MKRTRTMIVGIVCGIACAVCVLLYLQDVGARAEAARAEALDRFGGDQIEVCVAKRDIATGETIDEGSIEKRMWVADLLPESPVTVSAEVVGKQATSSILKGEVITSQRFEEALSAVEVPDDLTAVSVPARDVQTVGGALRPGMFVDVYATGQSSALLVAHSVLVLSTNASGNAKGSADSVSWVTLALSPENVQEVVSIAQSSQLYFTLPGDDVPDPLPTSGKAQDNGSQATDSPATANDVAGQTESTASAASDALSGENAGDAGSAGAVAAQSQPVDVRGEGGK